MNGPVVIQPPNTTATGSHEITATAYADGSCIGNPGPGGWGVHVELSNGDVLELGGGEARTTNNRMELRAAIEAVRATARYSSVSIIVDSEYVKNGITKWVGGWKAKGWRTTRGTPVENQALWQELDALVDERITWRWTRAHVGTPGNERVDAIANWFANGLALQQARSGQRRDSAQQRSPGRANPSGTRYLSRIDGITMRHRTWADCQERVHGVTQARFRKAQGDEEEREILASWGVRPEDVVEVPGG
jgi:ribonuclease HI